MRLKKFDQESFIQYWSKRFYISAPKCENVEGKEIGYYDYRNNTIYINHQVAGTNHMERAILHELRHAYQYQYFRGVYLQWIGHQDVYNEYYMSPICVIEEDANIVTWSMGLYDARFLLDNPLASLIWKGIEERFPKRKLLNMVLDKENQYGIPNLDGIRGNKWNQHDKNFFQLFRGDIPRGIGHAPGQD